MFSLTVYFATVVYKKKKKNHRHSRLGNRKMILSCCAIVWSTTVYQILCLKEMKINSIKICSKFIKNKWSVDFEEICLKAKYWFVEFVASGLPLFLVYTEVQISIIYL